jgi:hypothetical protein
MSCPYPEPDQTNTCNKANIVHPEGVWCKLLSQSPKLTVGYFLLTEQNKMFYYLNLFFTHNYLPTILSIQRQNTFFFTYFSLTITYPTYFSA